MSKKVTECKSCEKEVSKTARTCPHCGQKNPGINTGKGCLIIVVIAVVIASLIMLIDNGSPQENKSSFVPETNMAQEYVIIKNYEYPTPPDKKGLQITIFSEKSTTFEKRAHTAIKAALDILKENGLYEVTIRMNTSQDINKFNLMAYVQYNPYKKNTWGTDEEYIWSVEASDNEIKNGKLIEDGKSYPINYISVKKYLQK